MADPIPFNKRECRGAHGWCDRSTEDAYSSMAPDPTFAFVGGPFCPTLDLVIAFWIMIYVLHIVNFAILYFTTQSHHITPIDCPWEKDVLYWIWSQNVKGQVHWTLKKEYCFRALECYAFHLETPYHTYRLPIEGRWSILNLGSMVKSTGHQSRNMVSGL